MWWAISISFTGPLHSLIVVIITVTAEDHYRSTCIMNNLKLTLETNKYFAQYSLNICLFLCVYNILKRAQNNLVNFGQEFTRFGSYFDYQKSITSSSLLTIYFVDLATTGEVNWLGHVWVIWESSQWNNGLEVCTNRMLLQGLGSSWM